MNWRTRIQFCICKSVRCLTYFGLMLAAGVAMADQAQAQEIATTAPPQIVAHSDVRFGGTLAHSYGYHRNSPAVPATITPPAGWYGYGFPVKTHRWGWFGAAHYYPTVLWHRGYMGDQVRWAYRSGY